MKPQTSFLFRSKNTLISLTIHDAIDRKQHLAVVAENQEKKTLLKTLAYIAR